MHVCLLKQHITNMHAIFNYYENYHGNCYRNKTSGLLYFCLGIVPFYAGSKEVSQRFGLFKLAVNFFRNVVVLPYNAVIPKLQFECLRRFIISFAA